MSSSVTRWLRPALAAAVAVAGLAAGLATAGAAQAATGPVQIHERASGQIQQVPAITIPRPHLPGHLVRNGTSLVTNNWSGYAVQACGTCHLRYVAADFTIPSVNLKEAGTTSNVYWASHWAGLDGLYGNTVEQTGIDATAVNGAVVWYAWYEMYPASPVVFQLQAQPGDNISVAVYYNAGAKEWTLSLNDTTQAVGFTTTQAATSGSNPQNTSAEVISEDPGGAVPAGYSLLDFGQANYNSATVTSYSGTHGGLGSGSMWTSYPVTMANGPDVMATPGGLINGSQGSTPVSDFSDYWHAAS
jgi:hypothetical protein